MRAGATFPALFAMIARRHMYQYGTTREQMAAVAVKNHANGAKNPLAHMRKVITMEQALNGKPIAEPLTVYDCSLISDGAAAVLIVPLERAAEFTDKPVRVLGIAQTSDHVALDEKDDITTFRAVQTSPAEGVQDGRSSVRADIQFAEVHDCFTIAEIIAIEDLGFVKKGEGGPYALAGRTCIQGERPVNTSGGLKAKGHPVGATGVGQICDVAQQIRGEAGERQVARNSLGLAQNLGGSGATSVVTHPGGRMNSPGPGTVYTETVVYSPPEAYVNDVPYQLAIIELDGGGRLTGRIAGPRAESAIRCTFAEFRNGVAFFRKNQ